MSTFERLPRSLALAVGAAAIALSATAAQAAVQKTMGTCVADGTGGGNVVSKYSDDGWTAVPGLSRTLNNTTGVAKLAYVTFTADANVDPDAEMRLAFSLDGATGVYLGPQNLANNQPYWESRSTTAIISVPPGRHTITPMWHINGVSGKAGVMDDRCMVVTF